MSDRSSVTTTLPSCLQGDRAGLSTLEFRAPHVLRGLHVVPRPERVLGHCRCVSGTCENRAFHAWQHHVASEKSLVSRPLCGNDALRPRCRMRPAPTNIYNPEVIAALNSRGGPIWTRLLKGELPSWRSKKSRTSDLGP
ncbi:unnamed protein product [Durusdinium trenchii]|uniref:Uncharacterized protein n=1 Tax=Durusdinium trenchii TaxID=1381693 RepID=A0ABP0PIP8_9DINO